jgi:hypothetical protein
MDLSRYKDLEPEMLYSLLNSRLRNEYKDLDDLVAAWQIDRSELEAHMAEKGFSYHADIKQFR